MENVINLALEVEDEVSLQLGIEEPVELQVLTDKERYIQPKGRELKFITGGEASETDTDYLLLYNIAKL